jgi:Helicase HerA, central domain
MDPLDREALSSLRLTWAPTTDDLWRPQSALHVSGLNEGPLGEVMTSFSDALDRPEESPLGVVLRGPAGSGKTHMLGQVRERVQAAGGYFFIVELLDATSFWQSARAGLLESLGRPGVQHETQLKDVLWELASVAHVSRADRRALVGDDELTPDILERFVTALFKVHRETVRQCRHTLRSLVMLGSLDFGQQDIGQAYLSSNDEPDGRAKWGLPAPSATPQETVRDIARVVALAGPMVLAVDQIDTLLAQSAERTGSKTEQTDNRDLEHVAHGLMSVRQTMRRTVAVVACLPAAWESIRVKAVKSVGDRFRVTSPLKGLPTPELGRAILERRFAACYGTVGFTPPYPSWPIKPEAFGDAQDYTPRQLLKRADSHIRLCLATDTVVELPTLTTESVLQSEAVERSTPVLATDDIADDEGLLTLDARYLAYRREAVTSVAFDPEGEDTTMPELLEAALRAWMVEAGEVGAEFRVDPPPGAKVTLHARLRQTLDNDTDDEQHWAFRAIAASNAVAALNRIRSASDTAGLNSTTDRRKLFLLRNTPWPSGKKTAEVVESFEIAGGRTVPLSEDDLRTMIALRDLVREDAAHLQGWLTARKPAHGIALLRDALGEIAGAEAAVVAEPGNEIADQPASTTASADDRPRDTTAIPLGVDISTGERQDVDLAALRKHTAIFAGSGSGKTVLIRRIIEECALRGVSSIVLDVNNDLSRLGSPWPQPPKGWDPADDARAAEYLQNTEVVVWTPNRKAGRPLSFQPLPDFVKVRDDHDEFAQAVDSAVAALEPRALISGSSGKAGRLRAVLREALVYYGARGENSLSGFITLLGDLPDDASSMHKARDLAADIGQNLRAATINDPMFGGQGQAADPGVLLTPSDGYRARVSVISMIGLTSEEQREGFVNQLQMALFAWIKGNPAGDRPLGGLLVMDEAQNFAPSRRSTISLRSTLALSSQARKYGLGLVYATQSPTGLHNHIPGNAATQVYGLLNASAQITYAKELARVKGGLVPDISRLRAGNFYLATEGQAFHRIRSPWCLSFHPQSPPTTEEVLQLAKD